MKKQINIFLCMMIIIILPNPAGLVLNSNLQSIKNSSFDDYAPEWKLDNSWNYYINRFQINFSISNALMALDSYIDNLTVEMIGYSGSSYKLGLSGNIKGVFEYDSGEGMVLKGNLLFTKFSGNSFIRKNDLANEKTQIIIKGIVLLTEHTFRIPLPIPLPLTITVNMIQNNPRSFVDFPLYDGKHGLINETIISLDIKIESIILRIFSFFFEEIPYSIYYKDTYIFPMLNYSIKTSNITVYAGSFNTYNISFSWDLFGSIFYAPLVGNIVKIESVIEVPDQFMVLCIGELKDYYYQ
ncbi:MAG: hypothetical protein QHH15_06835 [Candidatus Thermoplasmatota archaeon]|jgi:hypothetical protein|nr:hypothetical protein [Candidatus Thermoplasmatota archaeon]